MHFKKGFSLLEIIFTITVISIIAAVAIPKLNNSIKKTNLTKIKNDVALIRNALIEYKNKLILSNSTQELSTLETSNDILFDKILRYGIKKSNTPSIGNWSKLSDEQYKVYINSQESVIFTYNSTDFTFDCDPLDKNCMEMTQ